MPELSPTVWIWIAIAVLIVFSYFRRLFGHPEEARILAAYAERTGGRFVPGTSGGPAVRFAAGGAEGEARFREGKRRFRLPRHVRVRIPLDGAGSTADDLRVRIVPRGTRHGRPLHMIHPAPSLSGMPALDDRYDLHGSTEALLHAMLDPETIALLDQRYPNVWIEVVNGRVEVRLAGNLSGLLLETAVGTAKRIRDVVFAESRSDVRLRD